jgi:hypothetical protein
MLQNLRMQQWASEIAYFTIIFLTSQALPVLSLSQKEFSHVCPREKV